MDVEEWQNRLEDTFGNGDIVGKNLLPGMERERAYKEHVVGKYRGHTCLTDCFFSFYLDTLAQATGQLQEHGWPEDRPWYARTYLAHVTNFKSLRAAENTFLSGYPLDAVALLRDLKDRAIFLAAIGTQLISPKALWGAPPELTDDAYSDQEKRAALRRSQIKVQKRVLDRMLRSKSGLSKETLAELGRWESLFHSEVHGSMLTQVSTLKQMREEGGFSPWPLPDEFQAAMYMNRAAEVGWMLVRTLPMLQLSPRAFGDEWAHKWAVLDDSLQSDVEALGRLGKRIAYAVIELVEKKFPFTPDTFYAE